ncbi:MAG: hypothetical protein VB108_04440 [Anaerolineaceae bacterium]|nr:hypothetical protein [Anaerolineaceae bacterium]
MEKSDIVIALNKNKRKGPPPAMDKITQSMKYRYALVQYALKHGVRAASRRYEKGRSYIYFWLKRFDGEMRSLGLRSRRPHHHPSEQTPEEIELILRYYRHHQGLGLLEFWFKRREVGYTRHYVSLYRAMQRNGLTKHKANKKTKHQVKPYEAMNIRGEGCKLTSSTF